MSGNIAGVDVEAAPFHLNPEAATWVKSTLASLDEHQRLGQLFSLVSYSADRADLESLVERAAPGGIMFRALPGEELSRGIAALQELSRVPVLVAANLEKGGDGLVLEGTHVGNPMLVAATGNSMWASRLGTVCGREARAVGAHWSFAPVVDVDFNFRNPITNVRTFGSDPKTVREMSVAYTRAVQEEGVSACAKHFPGDGVDERDQHLVTTSNDLGCDAWMASYGEIYRACIEAGAATIMAGHIALPEWSRRLRPGIADRDILPATLAPEILGDLLRGQLGFNGLIVSDASTMAGMAARMPRSEVVPRAIAAGCDMFLFTRNLEEDMEYMRQGIESGIVMPARVDEALTRILALKASLGMHINSRPGPVLEPAQAKEHLAWAREVAEAGITLVKDVDGNLPLNPKRHRRVLLHDLHGGPSFFDQVDRGADTLLVELLEAEGFDVTRFATSASMEGDLSPTTDTTDNYDLILYLARLTTRSNQTTVRIEWQQPMGVNVPIYVGSVPTVFVSVENPYHLLDVPQVPTFINTYDSGTAAIRALVDKLLGRSGFRGKSPVDAFCGRWDARI